MTDEPIQLEYIDALGQPRRPPPAAIEAIRRAMAQQPQKRGESKQDAGLRVVAEGSDEIIGPSEILLEDGRSLTVDSRLPHEVPSGYHTIRRKGERTGSRLIVAPRTCFLPQDLEVWGWAIQLYAARSRRSWGIGDLADLRRLGAWAARDGASIALVNPLAAATPVVPQQPSPYFPTSRRFRNPLYLRVEELDGAVETPGLAALARQARRLNRDRLINRDRVFELKLRAFESVWARVRHRRDTGFDCYREELGPALIEYATFCALVEKFGSGWRTWPLPYRNPRHAAVKRAAVDGALRDRVRFHAWLQYQLDAQLGRATAVMPIMQDLPIGFDADGADAWAFQDVVADGVTVGAPPDEFNTKGQNWGLPPFVPDRLRLARYEPFIQTIRACLRHAAGLRVDHVMGLLRLFWIPRDMDASDGAYVYNRSDELLAIVAIESQRARAVIVGEDLGTVDESFRQQLMQRCVLSYRLLWFEKARPSSYPQEALAAVTTHDLPTIAGMWTGSDLEAQKRLHLAPNEEGTREIKSRVRDLARAKGRTPLATVIARVHDALAAAPSRIVTATLDDAMAVEERPNMPATSDQWPNWSLALPRPIETLEKSPLATRIARALNRGRARAPTRPRDLEARHPPPEGDQQKFRSSEDK